MSTSPFTFGTHDPNRVRGRRTTYDLKNNSISDLNFRAVFVYWTLSVLVVWLISYMPDLPSDSARSVIVSSFFGGLVLLPLGRAAAPGFLREGVTRNRSLMRRAYLISSGDDVSTRAITRRMLHDGLQIVGVSIIRPEQADGGQDPEGLAKLCSTLAADVRTVLEETEFSEIYIRLPGQLEAELHQLLDAFAPLPVRIALLEDPDPHDTRAPSYPSAASLAGYTVVELGRPPISRYGLVAKRALDIAVASAALLVLLPIIAMACAAIAIESGRPIIFRQSRRGAGGRQFTILKLRSMSVQENGTSIVQASRNDPRITPLGAVFRKTSIDELPQLWNVLKGDMSIVGPRPHALAHDNYYGNLIGEYARRHKVKPGITGWAQVNGFRGETRSLEAMAERVKYDLWYIDHWTIWLDIKIIMKTAACVLFQKQAY
jgi:Undecaprenyl-phosphate glucose phosphotransferase